MWTKEQLLIAEQRAEMCDSVTLTRDSYLELLDTALSGYRDAVRYRWLRSQNWDDNTISAVRWPKNAIKLGHDAPSGERLDALIDEAMKVPNH